MSVSISRKDMDDIGNEDRAMLDKRKVKDTAPLQIDENFPNEDNQNIY